MRDQTVFISGGSGALGSAMVRKFAAEGCRVAFTWHRNAEKAEQLLAELRAGGAKVAAWPLDVLDKAACVEVVGKAEAELGPVDVLVNNAGVSQIMPFPLIEEDDWDLVLDTNVKGMFLVTKAFVRGMIRRRKGCIVNLGSLAGMRILEVPVHYATAKSAVLGFTLSLARELARFNIRVNAVVPGMINGGVGLSVPDAQREEYRHYCTMGRVGEPGEVADLVVFLTGEKAAYINAQTIFIDGGI